MMDGSYNHITTLIWCRAEALCKEATGCIALAQHPVAGSLPNAVGYFRSYVNVLAAPSNDLFCVWRPCDNGDYITPTLKLAVYRTDDLRLFQCPGHVVDALVKEMKEDPERHYLFADSVDCAASVSFDLLPGVETLSVKFPKVFKSFGEFIAVVNIPDDTAESPNTALVVINPAANRVDVYMQDWFNLSGKVDFGSQWITRAIRNPETGRIIVEGIRLPRLELDETNRQIKFSNK
jgi:hypothetical protein